MALEKLEKHELFGLLGCIGTTFTIAPLPIAACMGSTFSIAAMQQCETWHPWHLCLPCVVPISALTLVLRFKSVKGNSDPFK